MTVANQVKILDRKIKENKAQYDLDRKAAKYLNYLSENLDKQEYLTGEDLELKPITVEQKGFEYSPLGKFFNRRLKEEDKKEGLLKRLNNIEDKNEEQLKATEGKTCSKSKIDLFDKHLTLEAIDLIKVIKSTEVNVDYDKLFFTGGNKKAYGLDNFKTFEKLIKDIRSKSMTTDEAEIKHNKFAEKLD